ncbi:MAG: hypothetical protein ACKVLL_04030 [Verrucomicrobiales bacterium]|jgi:hypothetical protein|tara:strand:- start:22711 stop:23223 length:513 start_codon:yes stop_codon:yes gene_type:complete
MMIAFFSKTLKFLGLALSVCLLTQCGAPDSYQGNGIWLKADGSTYQGAAPVTVSRAQNLGSLYVRERVRVTEQESTNSQGQTVIREKEVTTVDMDFRVLVTLENGEQHEMSFSVSGDRNSSQYTSASFNGSNGYSYRASGRVQLSQYSPNFTMTISSKGISSWQGSIPLR